MCLNTQLHKWRSPLKLPVQSEISKIHGVEGILQFSVVSAVWQRQLCVLTQIIPSYQTTDLDQQGRQDWWIALWALCILVMSADSEQLPEKGLLLSEISPLC